MGGSVTLEFRDFADPSWTTDLMWVRAYVCPRLAPLRYAGRRIAFPLERVRGTIVVGALTYLHAAPHIEVTEHGAARIRTRHDAGLRETDSATHLILTCPHESDQDQETAAVLDAAEGLALAAFGGAVVYRRVFDNALDLGTGQITAYLGSIDNPAWQDEPDVSDTNLNSLTQIGTALAAVEPSTLNRIKLALRWLGMAGRERGVDAFLKYWIAIETLALPHGVTKVRPAEDLLSAGYGLDREATQERFVLGPLQRIRGDIVHNGASPRIPGEVSKFLEGLFFDLLHLELGLACPRRAAVFEVQGEFHWARWVRQRGASRVADEP